LLKGLLTGDVRGFPQTSTLPDFRQGQRKPLKPATPNIFAACRWHAPIALDYLSKIFG
jgi:hypothetical protein